MKRNNIIKIFTDAFKPASYDPRTGKIEGCKKYTYTWFHEMRHKEQFENKTITSLIDFLHIYGYYTSIATIVLTSFLNPKLLFVNVGFFMFPYVFGLFLLEIDATIMGMVRLDEYKQRR